MKPRSAVVPVVVAALVLVASIGGSAPAAHPGPTQGALDLLASAHPTAVEPAVTDAVHDVGRARGREVEADTAALTSTTCDGCTGESTALHVVYLSRPQRADLDNVATAWAQACTGCTSTALSVQVVVVRGAPTLAPNNRALSLTAACQGCRTSALAFQVVLVADRATPLSDDALGELRAWFDEQAAVLRASVVVAPPPSATPTPSPTPTTEPTTGPVETPTPYALPSDGATTEPPPAQARPTSARRLRRDATSALGVLEQLLADDLGGETFSADVEVGS
ncbi:hypothetical protein EUA06_15865 [Nocardioides glacieisoli]|uniref:Uncharacterized protein n=1 Tax=Nocardioides glacieisoli TaxID=1168730 RepID=A0A4Q2RL77_9ACTN|nr:hypothetical protein [Nocardioides glacieisoli]RYB89447.1 hypothetical protein EUA06_15865 [Nocardioides glacieisoli]